jgi:hypothetical protein
MNKLTSGFLQADLGPNQKDIKIKRLKKKAANQPVEKPKQRKEKTQKVHEAYTQPLEAQQSVDERVNTTHDEIQFIKKDETPMSLSHSQILDI